MPPLHTVDLCTGLAGTGIVLLPQSFAAQQVRLQMAAASSRSQPAAVPLAWTEWTASLWSSLLLQGQEDRILLNRLQEEQLWATVIAESPAGSGLSQEAVRDLAAMARNALALAGEHRLTPRLADAADTVDARVFAGWWEQLREHCRRDRLLPPALLEEALAVHLRSGAFPVPEAVHLVGFVQTTPAQENLLAALRHHHVTVDQHEPCLTSSPAGRSATVFSDAKGELRAAVRLLAERSRTVATNPPRFALVLPQPAEHRAELERLFRELLAPELESILTDLSSTPWNFSQPSPLRSAAVVQDALILLHWVRTPVSLDSAAHLLLSRYLTGAPMAELPPLPKLLRSVTVLRGTVALPEMAATLKHYHRSAEEPERARVEALAAFQEAAEQGSRPAQRSAGEWADVTRRMLHAAGWPGKQSLSPSEFRAVQAWDGLLDQLSTLQFDGSRSSFAGFLSRLTAEAGRVSLPGAAPGVPVQVLSLEECEGLTFDVAIHLDATDRNLPAPARRHPLLPQALQRSAGLGDPTTTSARTLAALASLAACSGELHLFASRTVQEGEAELTSFAEQLRFRRVSPEELLTTEPVTPPAKTELLADPQIPAVLEGTLLRGGVDVLRLQAACGFRAFSTHRLGADDPPRQALGLTPQDSGSLLHDAMQRIWQKLESQAALKAMPEDQRRSLVASCVEEAFAKKELKPAPTDPWTTLYLRIAQRRFTTLLTRWLQTELDRSPFTVLAQEEKQELVLGPVRFNVRPDRIDLADDGVVLVDYKTGRGLARSHWLGDRPDAPQLPAYALCERDQPLRGIAFAQVRPGEDMGWIPLSEAPDAVLAKRQKNTVDLTAQVASWRDELTRLAMAFAAGDTRVHPKDYPHTCHYCAHRLLCRLDPSTLLLEEELAGDSGEGETHG